MWWGTEEEHRARTLRRVGQRARAHDTCVNGLPKSGLLPFEGVGSFCSFIFGDLAFKSAGYRNLIGLDRDRDARRYDSPIYLTHKLSPDIHLLELEFCLLSLLHFRHSLLHPERQWTGDHVSGTYRERENIVFRKRQAPRLVLCPSHVRTVVFNTVCCAPLATSLSLHLHHCKSWSSRSLHLQTLSTCVVIWSFL